MNDMDILNSNGLSAFWSTCFPIELAKLVSLFVDEASGDAGFLSLGNSREDTPSIDILLWAHFNATPHRDSDNLWCLMILFLLHPMLGMMVIEARWHHMASVAFHRQELCHQRPDADDHPHGLQHERRRAGWGWWSGEATDMVAAPMAKLMSFRDNMD